MQSHVASIPFSEFSHSMSHHGYESLVDHFMNGFAVVLFTTQHISGELN